ncbi:uncharacterized protein LOC141667398 [Apium graveolens]|uniref:uncharacterized protein LOC141667398 n=1 Tax=Apium graveolens TaxID=4045 RepID=UPI003D7BFE5D
MDDRSKAMDDQSIKVCVVVCCLGKPEPFFLDGFKSSDTVGIVKNKVNDLVFNKPIETDFLPLHPATRAMVSSDGRVFGEDQTLVSLSESCGSKNITMHYLRDPGIEGTPKIREHLHLLRLTESARFIEEPHEGNSMQKLCLKGNDDEEPLKGKYIPRFCHENKDGDEKPNRVSIVKRPKTFHEPLPLIDSRGLGINGPCELFNSKKENIPFSSFKFAFSIKTTAHVILLAPTPEIFRHLVSLNTNSQYLILHVCWDLQSYFFLRALRTLYPKFSIVAVTDLDPHHLDLMTFLDTPPDNVLTCYGWDLSGDFDEDFDEYFNEDYNEDFDEDDETDFNFVNIKWLGLCPGDFEGLHFDNNARACLPGFDEVIRMLRVNPYLRRKEDWLAALDWLDLYGKCVSFNLGGDFISRKLSKKAWV